MQVLRSPFVTCAPVIYKSENLKIGGTCLTTLLWRMPVWHNEWTSQHLPAFSVGGSRAGEAEATWLPLVILESWIKIWFDCRTLVWLWSWNWRCWVAEGILQHFRQRFCCIESLQPRRSGTLIWVHPSTLLFFHRCDFNQPSFSCLFGDFIVLVTIYFWD